MTMDGEERKEFYRVLEGQLEFDWGDEFDDHTSSSGVIIDGVFHDDESEGGLPRDQSV